MTTLELSHGTIIDQVNQFSGETLNVDDLLIEVEPNRRLVNSGEAGEMNKLDKVLYTLFFQKKREERKLTEEDKPNTISRIYQLKQEGKGIHLIMFGFIRMRYAKQLMGQRLALGPGNKIIFGF
jgi:hypothetical protein